MRLGITVDMSGAHPKLNIDRVLEAERLGFAQAWTGEAYGTDAVTPATWMLAHTTKLQVGTGIMQIPARTPAMTATIRAIRGEAAVSLGTRVDGRRSS